MKKNVVSVFVLGGMLMLGCAYRHRPLINPQVEIINKISVDQVKTTVGRVLRVVGWRVESENPGVTVASLQKGELYAKIQVNYSETHVDIRHLDSRNFNYSNISGEGETIHSHYLSWVNNISALLNKALNSLPAK